MVLVSASPSAGEAHWWVSLLLKSPEWYQALSLVERLPQRSAGNVGPGQRPAGSAAAGRLAEWKQQSPFTSEEWYSKRLALNALDEAALLAILNESPASLKERFSSEPPSWLLELERAFASAGGSSTIDLPDPGVTSALAPVVNLFRPVVLRALDRLRRGARDLVQEHPSAPFSVEKAIEIFYALVPKRISLIAGRTAVLEFHVAQRQGVLGQTYPEDAFAAFIGRLRQPEMALALLSEYPVLARLVVEWLDRWAESSLEFLHRLCADWDRICSLLASDRPPGALEEVSGGIGDCHRRGRAVLIAKFSSGLQLVYKPKSLAVDRHFADLLDWLNARGAPSLRVPKVLDRGGYGWAEFIDARPCDHEEMLESFYRRLGAFLAIFYALEATDFHNENLIAMSEYPVPVDLESLFRGDMGELAAARFQSKAAHVLADSVLRVGLLPQRQWRVDRSGSVDRSGLGGEDGQLSLEDIPVWEDAGKGTMRLVRRRLRMKAALNQPQLEGREFNILSFSDHIVAGFTAMYRLLLDHRDGLLAADGPLERFSDDEVRCIFRDTRLYFVILRESFHPDLLRCALDRDRIFDRLWFGIDKHFLQEKLMRLIPSELEDLWVGDIPFFSTRVSSHDVWTGGRACLPNLLDKSGFDLVRSRLGSMSEEDLERQTWLIRASLTTLAMELEPPRKRYAAREREDGADSRRLLAEASRIGDRLAELNWPGDQGASWVGLSILDSRHWSLVPLGVDLYSGLPGIILFLAYLGRISAKDTYTQLAETALKGLQTQIGSLGPSLQSIGAFEGWGGVIYLYLHLAALWRRSDLMEEAERLIGDVETKIHIDESLDIVGGCAGAIAVMLGFHEITGSSKAVRAAREMGTRLVSRAQPCGGGVGWKVPVSPSRLLTGFSHGASGIAWSLLNLFAATGEERFRRTALAALSYEKYCFSTEALNWPDLRGDGDLINPKFMVAWCHGAPGIGLSRLRMAEHINDEGLTADLDAALKTTVARGFGANHSLCHGDLGNLELLTEAARQMRDDRLAKEADWRVAQILASIEEHGWLCGVPLGVETPGLMNGLAGIGLGLLRVAFPDLVPSVLMLDAPLG